MSSNSQPRVLAFTQHALENFQNHVVVIDDQHLEPRGGEALGVRQPLHPALHHSHHHPSRKRQRLTPDVVVLVVVYPLFLSLLLHSLPSPLPSFSSSPQPAHLPQTSPLPTLTPYSLSQIPDSRTPCHLLVQISAKSSLSRTHVGTVPRHYYSTPA